jgi:hypothetical protein
VTTLKFHREFYRGTAVDEAVKMFAAYAEFSLREESEHWVVQLSTDDEARERTIAGELGNWALGLTVQKRGR